MSKNSDESSLSTSTPKTTIEPSFDEIVAMIGAAKQSAAKAVNSALVELYWQIGEYLFRKIETDGWGKRTVSDLSVHVQRHRPGIRAFSPQNLWRMRQFHEAWKGRPILSALLRELPWTHHLIILGQSKGPEEQEFYLRGSIQEGWSSRELERQFRSGFYERMMLSNPKTSLAIKQKYPEINTFFKDSYLVEFLDLSERHSEQDLHRGLLKQKGIEKI